MVQFTLPKNSKITKGKHHPAPAGAKTVKAFKIYRFDPETGANPRWDTYDVAVDQCGPMVLDAIFHIKNTMDPTLSFRRSCREGVCGSCAMNIGGRNTLACTHAWADVPGEAVQISPLPNMPVLKDLVPDLTLFFAQYASIEPWLQADTPMPQKEWTQSPKDRAKLDGLYECILCACCSSSTGISVSAGVTTSSTTSVGASSDFFAPFFAPAFFVEGFLLVVAFVVLVFILIKFK